ncbi:protein ATP1B4 [Geospiza fortis]|uniref:Protein ATP1B4 n=1 Tax=Geospiza fortis TaxID=48883 RepID=A0A8N5ELN2_GEOFO|nr:protein ATP1B4 [Geospiza fortis]
MELSWPFPASRTGSFTRVQFLLPNPKEFPSKAFAKLSATSRLSRGDPRLANIPHPRVPAPGGARSRSRSADPGAVPLSGGSVRARAAPQPRQRPRARPGPGPSAEPRWPQNALKCRRCRGHPRDGVALAVPALPRAESKENKHEEKVQDPDREKREPKADMGSKTWADLAGEMKIFLWNPEERTCLGRTAKSWGLILLFYFIFYTCLAGMFAFCLYVMLLTLSPYTPRYRDRVSPPGVMIRPYLNGFTIAFNVSQPSTWQPYVDSMHHFLAAYDDKVQEEKNIECVPGQYFIQGGSDSEEKKACQFKRSLLQNCSGIQDPTFGFSHQHGCFLLLQIIGYRPGAGVPVSVECKVQKGNESHLRSVDFYPGNGTFDLMYYPYYGKFTHVNYTSPLVAMHFTDVQRNYLVPIQCSLNGKGIINDLNSDRFLGRIIFTLSIGK